MTNLDTKCKLTMEKDKCTIKDIDPSLLHECKVYTLEKNEDLTEEFMFKAMDLEVCLLRNFDKACNVDNNLFAPHLLR